MSYFCLKNFYMLQKKKFFICLLFDLNMVVDRIQVEREAKEILDKFAATLEKVEKEKGEDDSYVERDEFEREEKEENCCTDNRFKERILENAPSKDNDFIIAEKGSWK